MTHYGKPIMSESTLATSLPTIEEIRAAQDLVYSVMPATPQIAWPLLRERLGTEVWVKHENHTPIGAFKARTAIVYAAELFRGTAAITGLVTATRGNHGQSVALAAQRFSVPAHIVVPRGNSITRTESCVGAVCKGPRIGRRLHSHEEVVPSLDPHSSRRFRDRRNLPCRRLGHSSGSCRRREP